MLQNLAWSVSLLLIGVIIAVFIWAIRHSQADKENAHTAPARWRSRSFWTLSILFVPLIGYSLTDLPYAAHSTAGAEPIVVQATGYQWRWELSRTTLPVGQPIEFHVTAADVNHGFSLYDANLQLQTQTQAMPGVINILRHTFDQPGTYKVFCMEYCGLAHHNMTAEIQVVAEQ
jgi:cytochrome c oxidase subunit 2